MVRRINDGTGAAPKMRCYMNLLALEGVIDGPVESQLESIAEAGYDGVQFVEDAMLPHLRQCDALGLGRCGLGRVNRPQDAGMLATRLAAEGMECGTVHLGWGIEDDTECYRLIESVLQASDTAKIPLYMETHRATIFQDMWRTVQFVKRYPEMLFNGDFSHWYTGLEMVYGGFENKLEFIRPVIERTAFLHGRIGNPGCIQVDIGDGNGGEPYIAHFVALWTEVFRNFRRSAGAGDYILFVPELLSPRIYYGRPESDRWTQSLVLRRIAESTFGLANA